jgi:hypothetical protein
VVQDAGNRGRGDAGPAGEAADGRVAPLSHCCF